MDSALDIIRAVRRRYDGRRRNPYDEAECGYHYFSPVGNGEFFRCFFSTGSCWGVYQEWKNAKGEKEFQAVPLFGSLEGVSVNGMIKRTQYPRPQFVREEWMNLNGTWDFLLGMRRIGET